MKYTLKVAAAALGLSVATSSAYDVFTTNFSTTSTGLPVLANDGSPLADGLVVVGTFPVGFNFDQPAADVIAGMTLFGGALMEPPFIFDPGPPPIEGPGFFGNTISASIPNDAVVGVDPFFGQVIYTLIGDATDSIANSSFIAVLSDGQTFGQENSVGAGAISTLYDGPEDIVYGSAVGPVSIDVPGIATFNFAVGAQQENVPEPSTSLLAGLAALGLLIRRRR